MSQNVKGSFSSGASVCLGQFSSPLMIPTAKGLTGTYQLKLTIPNNAGAAGGPSTIDASNTAKTQKSTDGGFSWVDQTTYNSAQALTLVTVVGPDNLPATPAEQWRLALVSQQALKSMEYSLSMEN